MLSAILSIAIQGGHDSATYNNKGGCTSGCPDFDPNNPDIDWDKFDQKRVPANRIKDIPKDKVDVTAVKDKSKLTIEQVGHGDNYNQITDKSELSKEVRDFFFEEGAGADIDSELSFGTTGSYYTWGFSFSKANSIKIDNTFVSNAIV